MILIFICGCSNGINSNEVDEDIEKSVNVKMSFEIIPADINDKRLAYYAGYSDYKNKDEYEFYNCFFEVENNSKYDVLDLMLPASHGENYIIDYWGTGYCPYLVKSNEVGYVSGVISVKKDISETEKSKIINDIEKEVIVRVGNFYADKDSEILYAFKKNFEISRESYLDREIEYPDELIGVGIIL